MKTLAMTAAEAYQELSYYTLAHPGTEFIHQHIVDAYMAQEADARTKPMGLFFALAGLYLFIEKGYTGREVQQAHQRMSRHKSQIPQMALPATRGSLTVVEVFKAPPGPSRDDMIRQWCASVWNAFAGQHTRVRTLTERLLAEDRWPPGRLVG